MGSKSERKLLLSNTPRVDKSKGNYSDGEVRVPVTNNVGFVFAVVFSSLILDFGSEAKSQYIIKYTRDEFEDSNTTNSLSSVNVSVNSCGKNGTAGKEETSGQKLAAQWNFYYSIAEHVVTLPVVIIVGIYCDKIGRKTLFMISTIGMFLQYGVKAYIIYKKLPLFYFVIASVVEGLTGGRFLFSIARNASIADTTERNQARTVALAFVDVLLGIGTFGAKIATGYMIQSLGYVYPVILTTGLNFILVVIIWCFVPETLKIKSSPESTGELFKKSMSFFYDRSRLHGNERWKFFLCFAIFVSLEFSSMAVSGVGTIYKMSFPFCWDTTKIGWYSAATSLIHTTLGAILLKVLVKYGKDEPLAILGLLSVIGERILEGLATDTWMFYLATSVAVMSLLPGTIIRSTMSQMVDDSKQGSFFMVYELVVIVTAMAGASLSTNIYEATLDVYRGIVYFIGAGMYIVVAVMVLILYISGGVNGHIESKHKTSRKRSATESRDLAETPNINSRVDSEGHAASEF